MNKKFLLLLTLGMGYLFCFQTLFAAQAQPEINLQKVVELGRDEPMFQHIESLCEDAEENFYVLDSKAFKVYKFSPSGKLLLSFGNRGEGPGEFRMPGFIRTAAENTPGPLPSPANSNAKETIVVCDAQLFVYFFDTQGKFLTRLSIQQGLDLSYLGPDLYCGWTWRPKVVEQFLLNSKGDIIKTLLSVPRDVSSVGAPDETGRMVQTNYSADEYTPMILFSNFRDRSVFAVTDRYRILLVDDTGKILKEITRDIKPLPISSKEKEVFLRRIDEQRYIKEPLKKEFKKKIPPVKNYFDNILVSARYIFVSRIKADITVENSPITMDIFNREGEFLGSAIIAQQPFYISERFAYVIKEEDEELLLVKYKWNLK